MDATYGWDPDSVTCRPSRDEWADYGEQYTYCSVPETVFLLQHYLQCIAAVFFFAFLRQLRGDLPNPGPYGCC
jgi:hypothetical protein